MVGLYLKEYSLAVFLLWISLTERSKKVFPSASLSWSTTSPTRTSCTPWATVIQPRRATSAPPHRANAFRRFWMAAIVFDLGGVRRKGRHLGSVTSDVGRRLSDG
ncbi:hypothetical protein QR680_016665 [Steinernema hermaphroditum]|uniref:Uncharacterized protein n=1 Tax=Steinernema hermaphroditum TaxID=289476 RepID=A0AA39LMP9_9BILA|nr:hypothetical protein QR680_016665 [Steinernema hermaphroditum]